MDGSEARSTCIEPDRASAHTSGVKRFEVYRRDKGRTGIWRILHHDPRSGRSWITEVHSKHLATGEIQRVERVTALDDMDPEERARYELRLSMELDAEQAARPAV